jgi:hypothetical protein
MMYLRRKKPRSQRRQNAAAGIEVHNSEIKHMALDIAMLSTVRETPSQAPAVAAAEDAVSVEEKLRDIVHHRGVT